MNASSSRNQHDRRAVFPGCAGLIVQLLRLFWFSALALLLVVAYGLFSGWSTPRQWSDGFFIAAILQVVAATAAIWSPAGEAADASTVRYVDHASVDDTQRQLLINTLGRQNFAVRVFLGALLTTLIAAIFLWLPVR